MMIAILQSFGKKTTSKKYDLKNGNCAVVFHLRSFDEEFQAQATSNSPSALHVTLRVAPLLG